MTNGQKIGKKWKMGKIGENGKFWGKLKKIWGQL